MKKRAAPTLLAHVNLMLTLYGGAALASAARLKWDPSTYVVLRELFPVEYRAVAAAATAGGFTLLLLPHVAAVALHASRPRSRAVLLYVYAAVLTVLMAGELAFGGWLVMRALAWWHSAASQQLAWLLEASEDVRSYLQFLGRWHPLPQHIDELIQEAQEDAPRNLYVALALAALLALLQLTAAVAALLAACAAPARAPAPALAEVTLQPSPPSNDSSSSFNYQKMPRTKMLRKAPERPHRYPGASAQETSPPPPGTPAHPVTRVRLSTLWGWT